MQIMIKTVHLIKMTSVNMIMVQEAIMDAQTIGQIALIATKKRVNHTTIVMGTVTIVTNDIIIATGQVLVHTVG